MSTQKGWITKERTRSIGEREKRVAVKRLQALLEYNSILHCNVEIIRLNGKRYLMSNPYLVNFQFLTRKIDKTVKKNITCERFSELSFVGSIFKPRGRKSGDTGMHSSYVVYYLMSRTYLTILQLHVWRSSMQTFSSNNLNLSTKVHTQFLLTISSKKYSRVVVVCIHFVPWKTRISVETCTKLHLLD